MPQISFLPYFPSATQINLNVNRIHLFNFWQHKDEYITDPVLRAKIENLAAMYVDSDLTPSRNFTVAVFDNTPSFNPLNAGQLKDLRRYVLALMFCSLTQNAQNSAWASDHFTLLHQNFDLSGNEIGYSAGSYTRLQQLAIPIDRKKFVKPDFVTDSLFYRYDNDLLQAFANAIDAQKDDDDYLFELLEWVRVAFMNVDGYSSEIRPTMMATAFEILFDLREGHKEDDFASQLEALLCVDQMQVFGKNFKPLSIGLPTKPGNNARGRPKENTIYGWWARDFYSLRSKIVHEGVIAQSDWVNHNQKPHLEIALKVMNFCLHKKMENDGYLIHEESPGFPGVSVKKLMVENRLRKSIEDLIKEQEPDSGS